MPKMNEKQLIEAIRELKEIKPNQEWVSLIKSQILAEQPAVRIIPARKISTIDVISSAMFQRKMAYALASFVFVIAGMFGFAQYTVPGDLLFSVKKFTETQNSFQVAYNRSAELVQVLKENKTQNIAPAVSEFKASMSGAAKNLVASLTQQNSKQSLKDISDEVKKIQENQRQAETLGIDISETDEVKELNSALAVLVQNQIDDLEKATLTEDQQETLVKIKDSFSKAEYSEALEEILLINQ